uniref:Uncharacterized protein n=1 Tax=Panagrellus redivivus TaxID=6233 RepID=A0A7E4UTG4_PANRE
MRLPIVVLLVVVAASTVGAQKHEDPDCGFGWDFPCDRSAIPAGLAQISGSNAAKEQEAVDKLAAIGLLNAISQVAENSPPEQTRGFLGTIIRRAKSKAKGLIRRVKHKAGRFGRCRPGSCKPGCRRFCNLPRPRPIEPSYYPEPPAYIDGEDIGQLTQSDDFGGYEARPRVQTFFVN